MDCRRLLCLALLLCIIAACPLNAFAVDEPTAVDVIQGTLIPTEEGQYISVNALVSANCSVADGTATQGVNPSYHPTFDVNNVETVIYSDGAHETSCEVTVGLIDPNAATPYASQSRSKTESAITGTVKITYYLANGNTDIKVTNVSGSWSQTYADTGIDIKDMEVTVLNGCTANFHIQEGYYYPTDRTFSFNTGWDYFMVYPTDASTGAGTRTFSDCKWRISGMGTTWYTCTVSLWLDIA